ncbi:MAG: S41 family peptidase [Acidobacteriota bacterium]
MAGREELDGQERVDGLARLRKEVDVHFVNFDRLPDVDWNALCWETLPLVRNARTLHRYYEILRALIAKLRDGHTSVALPEAIVDEVRACPLMVTQLVEGRVFVASLLDGTLERQGVAQGQEILAIDDIPVEEYAANRVVPYVSASTPQDLAVRAFEISLLEGPLRQPVTLTFRNAKDAEFVCRLAREPRFEKVKRLADEYPPIVLRKLPGNVAHLVLNTFAESDVVRYYEELASSITTAAALLLDIRDNRGGFTSVGFHILGHLTDQRHLVGRWWKRYGFVLQHGETWLEGVGMQKLYNGPVAVLAGPRTYSAAEDFAAAFDVMGRGLLVGEPTGGCTGQSRLIKLPGGGSARVCSRRDTYPDGSDFVGIGIQPDRLVNPSVDDFRSGRDSVLEAALEAVTA